jgi:putative transposase
MRKKIRNLIDEVHKKSALWLLRTFDVVIIPEFNGGAMSRRKTRKIGCKTVRRMLTWSHYRFRQRLLSKATEMRKIVITSVSEAYTSKTCTGCGYVRRWFGKNRRLICSSCGLVIDRDLNGARNIFLRALLEGVIAISAPEVVQGGMINDGSA